MGGGYGSATLPVENNGAIVKSYFYITCNDKDHRNDLNIVSRIRKLDGVKSADSTYLDFGGKKYCICVTAQTRSHEETDALRYNLDSINEVATILDLRDSKRLKN